MVILAVCVPTLLLGACIGYIVGLRAGIALTMTWLERHWREQHRRDQHQPAPRIGTRVYAPDYSYDDPRRWSGDH